MKMTLRTILGTAGLVLLTITCSHAQTGNGAILGTITDLSGAVIPKAQVTIVNQDNGTVRTSTSSDDGLYNVPSLPAGTYTVRANMSGFSPFEVKNAVVTVGSPTQINIRLSVGQVAQSVTVTDAPPEVQTTTVEVSTVMQEATIAQIPLNARDVQQLAAIQPGVNKTGTFQYGPEELSIMGSRPDQNQYRQEGMNAALTTLGIAPANGVGVELGVEAVKEFAVLGGNFTPEYGGAGGIINLIFKSGTNVFHGSAYEFFRGAAFDTRNPFDTGSAPPPYKRNQFGASIGGPIRRNRTFFFANYEGLLESLDNTQVAFYPDDQARGIGTPTGTAYLPCGVLGSIAACAGQSAATREPVPTPTSQAAYAAGIQQVFFTPVSSQYAQLIPSCLPSSPELLTSSGGPSGACRQVVSPTQTTKDNFGVIKIDQVISSTNRLSSSYNYEPSNTISPGPNPNFADILNYHKQIFTLQDTEIFTAHVINALRFGLNRTWWQQLNAPIVNADPRLFVQPDFFVNGYQMAPTMSITGITGISYGGLSTKSPNVPKTVGYTKPDLTDDLTYVLGDHLFQIGGEVSLWQENLNTPGSPGKCTCQFSSEESFLEGGPTTVAQLLIPQFGNGTQQSFGKSWREKLFALYINDTFKMKSNLTLTYGLRWEYEAAPSEKHGYTSSLYNPTPETALTYTTGQPLFHASTHLVSPRLGINWDPFKKGTSSLRAGFGIFYNQISLFDFVPYESSWYPQYANIQLSSKFLYPAPTAAATLAEFTGGPLEYQGTTPPYPDTPTKYAYNLEFQKVLPFKLTMLVGYVGSFSRHLVRPIQWSDYYPILQAPGTNTGCGLDQPGGVAPAGCGCPTSGASAFMMNGNCLFWPGNGLAKASCTVNPGPVVVGVYPCPASTSKFGLILGSLYDANADYNAFQFALERKVGTGLSLRLNYTHGSCLTDSDGAQTATAGNGGNSPYVFRSVQTGHARCSYNAEDTVNGSLNYVLPFAKMVKRPALRAIVGGFVFSSLTTMQTGIPFEITSGANISRDTISGAGNDRPNLVSGCTRATAINRGNPTNYIKANCFVAAPFGYLGTFGPLGLTGPGLEDTDLSIKRELHIRAEHNLELRLDIFNALNHSNYGLPLQTNATVFTNAGSSTAPNLQYNPVLGQILSTATTSRQLQFSGRYSF